MANATGEPREGAPGSGSFEHLACRAPYRGAVISPLTRL